MDPAYVGSRAERLDLVVFLLALHTGLAIQEMLSPAMVDMDKQLKMIGRLFGKESKQGKRLGK